VPWRSAGVTTQAACLLQGSAQWEFMAKDLAAVNRSVTPWLVVGHHRPYYAPTVSLAEICNTPYQHLPPWDPTAPAHSLANLKSAASSACARPWLCNNSLPGPSAFFASTVHVLAVLTKVVGPGVNSHPCQLCCEHVRTWPAGLEKALDCSATCQLSGRVRTATQPSSRRRSTTSSCGTRWTSRRMVTCTRMRGAHTVGQRPPLRLARATSLRAAAASWVAEYRLESSRIVSEIAAQLSPQVCQPHCSCQDASGWTPCP